MSIPAAFTKSSIAWIVVDTHSYPVWYASTGEVAYVVSGPGEQPLAPLPPSVGLILRDRDSRARAATVTADVQRLQPGTSQWNAATTALLAARQNTPPGDTLGRWAALGSIWCLRPRWA